IVETGCFVRPAHASGLIFFNSRGRLHLFEEVILTKKSKSKKSSNRPEQLSQDTALASAQEIPATIQALNGETQPLQVIAPLFDTASALSSVTPRIIAAAKASAIARFDWKNRGPASIGYTAGMAVAYAAAFARLQAHDPVADRMSRALEPVFRDSRGR